MTKEVYKRLVEWNPKKGDLFEDKIGGRLKAVSDTHARFGWNIDFLFSETPSLYKLIGQDKQEESSSKVKEYWIVNPTLGPAVVWDYMPDFNTRRNNDVVHVREVKNV